MFWEQIFYNVLGGAIVAALSWVYIKLLKKYHKRNFKNVFGRYSTDNFHIVYGEMWPRPDNPMEWPYYKPGDRGHLFKVSSVVSVAQTRSVKYLAETFGKISGAAPTFVSDYEIKDKLDISFLSVGGLNNFKTRDVLESSENRFFDFERVSEGSPGIYVKGVEGKRYCIRDEGDKKYDYGFIIKIMPGGFPNMVWIAIAGIGEWGTSGAAWFLSKNWKKLPENKAFGLILEVRAGQDESAKIVHQM